MLQIKCTKKLIDEMKIKPAEIEEIDPLFSWHANIIVVNRRKTVYLMNDATRMIIVLHGLKAANFKKLNSLLLDAIEENLIESGVNEELVKKYIEVAQDVYFTKTDNKSIISNLNLIMGYSSYESFDTNKINQIDYNMKHLESLVKVGDDYIEPIVLIDKCFDEFGKGNFGETYKKRNLSKAYEFNMQLNLSDYNVWRNIIVPANINFKKFHFVLQDAFGWFNYHLHEFTVFNDDEEPKPVALIIMSKDVMEYDPCDIKVHIESIKLESFIPKYSKILYAYDFGDGWEVLCELKRTIEDYEHNYAICIDGEGDSPPEDVGGEPGYADFRNITSDENNPEYDGMKTWAEGQGFEKWNIDNVNKRLLRSLKRFR